MSGMNWVDGDYVFEDMHKLARERRGAKGRNYLAGKRTCTVRLGLMAPLNNHVKQAAHDAKTS